MDNDNITQNPDPIVNLQGTIGGDGAVGGQNPQEQVIPLSELKNFLGKDFKDKDSALKSLKDTQTYVGRVGQLEQQLQGFQGGSQPVATGEVAALREQIDSIQRDGFFNTNPQYKSIRPVVEKLAKAEGKGLHEIVELPEFKDMFSKVEGFEKSQGLRTVLESNPRLASSQDKLSKAQGLVSTRSRKALAEASDLAIQAVMDATPGYSD